jgi:hypothetical protein
VRIAHLEQRLRQTDSWSGDAPMTSADLQKILMEKFADLDVELAKRDVMPFVRDSAAVAVWSKDFFLSLVPRLESC